MGFTLLWTSRSWSRIDSPTVSEMFYMCTQYSTNTEASFLNYINKAANHELNWPDCSSSLSLSSCHVHYFTFSGEKNMSCLKKLIIFFFLSLSFIFLLVCLQSRLPVVTIMEAVVISVYSPQSNHFTAVHAPPESSSNQMERHANQVGLLFIY